MSLAFRCLTALERFLLAWSMLLIAALTISNVAARTLFGTSFASAEEVSRMLILVITFVGLSHAASQGRHIRMTALHDLFGRRGRKALMLLVSGGTAALMGAFAFWGAGYVETVRALGTVSPVLRIPLWLVYLVAPLGFALACAQYVLTFVRNVRDPDVWVAPDRRDGYDAAEPGPTDA